MTPHHHASDELLLAYAAGGLDESLALLVATHLALCPHCRAEVERMEVLGGTIIEDLPPAPVASDALDVVLDRLDEEWEGPPARSRMEKIEDESARMLPQPLRDYLGGRLNTLKWRKLGPGVRQFQIIPRREGIATSLLRIAPNTAIPHHGHGGSEHTLVLAGSYMDETGQFRRGDVQSADDELTHRPVSGGEEECYCLIVADAPLRFTGLAGRILQPFLRF